MLVENMENGIYTCTDTEDGLLCKIETVGKFKYHAKNINTDLTAEVIPIEKDKVKIICHEHKRHGKDGKYRKTTKLKESDLKWLWYMLQEQKFEGFEA